MRILHFSDLHFGCDRDATELEKRSNYHNTLLKQIEQINKEKVVNYLVISGDVAWKARDNEYKIAGDYIRGLCDSIGLSTDKLIICPGNHDIDRDIAKHDRVPNTFEEANNLYRVEDINLISRSFRNFEKFCSDIGLKQAVLRDGEIYSYLAGIKKFDDVNFVILNSSWASINEEYNDKMWIGNNLVETINASNMIDSNKVTITLMHHPEESLIFIERSFYNGMNNTYRQIQDFSDLILSGHTHETKVEPKPLITGGYAITSGAAYVSNVYKNGIVCYDIDGRTSFDITPYSFENNEWKNEGTKKYSLKNEYKDDIVTVSKSSDSVYKQLLNLGFRIENCQESDFSVPGTIIWPVVPRNNVTHIHQAQIELMSVMSNLYNWKVKVLISDCGSKATHLSSSKSRNFVKLILKLLIKRKVEVDNISCLSGYFEPTYKNANEIFRYFISISSNINKKTLTELKNKKYNDNIQESNEELPVLDYILPLLQMSVVCHLGNEIHKNSESKKTLILAGSDEINQWGYICREYGEYLGALLIPTLRDDENTDSWQQGIRKYLSSTELKEDISKGNFGFWCYCMFIKLQELNEKNKLCDFKLSSEKFEYWRNNQFSFPEDIDCNAFVEEIWKVIGLAI